MTIDKLNAINEFITSTEKDKCTCKGKMFLCNRCCLLNNMKEEKEKIKNDNRKI